MNLKESVSIVKMMMLYFWIIQVILLSEKQANDQSTEALAVVQTLSRMKVNSLTLNQEVSLQMGLCDALKKKVVSQLQNIHKETEELAQGIRCELAQLIIISTSLNLEGILEISKMPSREMSKFFEFLGVGLLTKGGGYVYVGMGCQHVLVLPFHQLSTWFLTRSY